MHLVPAHFRSFLLYFTLLSCDVQEHHLRALRLLPSIVRLHRLLLSRFNHSIDHAEATSINIGTVIEEINDGSNPLMFTVLYSYVDI